MATTKKRRRRPSGATAGPAAGAARGGANEARRERKEQARRAREAERKRAVRQAAFRRAMTVAAIGAVAVGVFWWINRAAAPRPIPQAAVRAAEAAGCTAVETPLGSAPGDQHLQAGQSHTYDQHPATSGLHDPSPLPLDPKVYDSPINETNAVHNLEHAGAIVYYRASGEAALPAETVDALESVVNASTNVLMAPYPDLPKGQALALTAWDKLQTCPPGVTPEQATTIANGFIEAYVCTRNAPEPNASGAC
ncbi:MAG: DUF3105 domain-containing protein [Actinomycetota bacterium]